MGFIKGKEKTVVAAVFAVASILAMAYLTGEFNSEEFVLAVLELGSVLGVFAARNSERRERKIPHDYR